MAIRMDVKGAGLAARGHNEECRARIEREMRQDPELSMKVEMSHIKREPSSSEENPQVGSGTEKPEGRGDNERNDDKIMNP